ncbi:MAG: 16S rRNA (cytosine(1402)-N(4))-methyltransferase RsmH [Balneolaceae bacterium]
MAIYHDHIPVLLSESLDLLLTDPEGKYVDGTLGGGGHSAEILARLAPSAELWGVDQDLEALDKAGERLKGDARFHTVFGNFGYMSTLLPPSLKGKVSGILLDLGVSTHQIREPGRGFSFQNDGPLDMRMDRQSGLNAHEVVNSYSYERLRDLIFHFGEERMSRQIASEIIKRRPLGTTGELAEAVEAVAGGRFLNKSLARVFQAIRIEVNRELDQLERALYESLHLLKEGGRLVVISYHSLEDRMVKRFFRSGNLKGEVKKDFYGNWVRPLDPVTRQVVRPGTEEVGRNPASRSARLRAAERTGMEVEI